MKEHSAGEWVRFEDHERELAASQARVKELESHREQWRLSSVCREARLEADTLRAEVEQANKACAEMREALQPVFNVLSVCRLGWEAIFPKIEHALSADCGKDYIHKSEVERLTKELSLEKDKAECAQKNYEEATRLWHEATQKGETLCCQLGNAMMRIAQLEAALTKLSTINRNNVNCSADYVVKVAMKALSAPTIHPSELEGIKSALKDVVEVERPIPQEDEWKCRLIDALIVRHLYRKEHDSDPVLAIDDLISWEIKVACDPLVNGGRVLIPQEVVQKMAEALTEAISIIEGDNTHSDSYGVEGSDWGVCDLCDAEDGPGVFAKGIPHTEDCPIYKLNQTLALYNQAKGQP